jgi:hypothetical protein
MTPRRRGGPRHDARSKSNYLRRKRVARAKTGERRALPNGAGPSRRRRV